MKLLFILLLLIPFALKAQKKIEFRGLFAGAQTISAIAPKESFSHSIYAIGLVGYKRVTFNTQFIVPVFPNNTSLIKFGIDIKIL